jgi:hypothetical protein
VPLFGQQLDRVGSGRRHRKFRMARPRHDPARRSTAPGALLGCRMAQLASAVRATAPLPGAGSGSWF